MKRLVVTLALAASSVSALSDDGWVSVRSTRVAPASSEPIVTLINPRSLPHPPILVETFLLN